MSSSNSGPPSQDYLLGSRDEELERLAFQHRVWAEDACALWRRAGFRHGARILDLGCGPGFTTVDLAHLVGPRGHVVAADSSRKFLEHLRSQAHDKGLSNITTLECDVHEIELEPQSLDGAYARWIFCFLKDPRSVVRRVARALRPGATFAVTDYFNYRAFTFAPRSAIFDRVITAVGECWRLDGGDLEVQGSMPGFMRDCGLDVVEVSQTSRVAKPGSPLWNWPLTFFKNFMPTLVSAGLVTPEDRQAFEREWDVRAADPASHLYLPPMTDVVGIRR